MPRTTGSYETTSVAGENVRAFIPHPLPPASDGISVGIHIGEKGRRAIPAQCTDGILNFVKHEASPSTI